VSPQPIDQQQKEQAAKNATSSTSNLTAPVPSPVVSPVPADTVTVWLAMQGEGTFLAVKLCSLDSVMSLLGSQLLVHLQGHAALKNHHGWSIVRLCAGLEPLNQ
jgi:hypothetical protein